MYSEKAQKALLPERLLGFSGFLCWGKVILSCEHEYFTFIHDFNQHFTARSISQRSLSSLL